MLRNKEFRLFVLLFCFIAAAVVTMGFTISSSAGLLSIVTSVAFGTAFYVFTRTRYRSIAKISDEIDLVLHNTDHLYFADAQEGELSILHSEITKMTLRIREQNEALIREKKHLADSLADIAHQLRTPLTSVNLILSLLENTFDETERKKLLREIEELFVQMDWLLTSLLKLSRLDAGIVVFQRDQVEVKSLIHTALRPFLISLELHNINVQFDIPNDVFVQGDLNWLSESIQNVIKNCMESAGNNGKIEITGVDNPLYTEITIHDNGPGFRDEDLSSLFQRFYRGKNSTAAGFGIGLALSKMIITSQGGSITAKNHPHEGAIFAIRFPK
jgi:signal transduction histidine kinase